MVTLAEGETSPATPGDGPPMARDSMVRMARAAERRGALSLRFDDPALERRFREVFDPSALPLIRAAVAIGLVGTAAWSGLDIWLVGEEVGPALVVRGVLLAGLGAVLWALYQPWWARVPQVQQLGVPGVTVLVSVAFDAMTVVSPMPPGYAALASMMIIVFLGAFGTTFGSAAVGTTMIVLAYVGSALLDGEELEDVVYYLAFMANFAAAALGSCYLRESARRRGFLAELELAAAHARSEALLRNVLPDVIVDRLRERPGTIAEAADEVSVIFADIVGFTQLSTTLTPTQLVSLLDDLFRRFDALCDVHGIEKIKTIGDAYMGVAGVPTPCPDHAAVAAEMALDMLAVARAFEKWPGGLELRVGISSGPVVAGVIGNHKFAYDLWGDTVNTASRMESHGSPGAVQVSDDTFRLLEGRYAFGPPSATMIKGKGRLTTHVLLSRHS